MKERHRPGAPALAFLLALLALIGQALPARAATPDWGRQPYTYVTVDQDLPQLLREFAANIGVTIQISPNVQGTVRGRLPSLPPKPRPTRTPRRPSPSRSTAASGTARDS